MKSFLTLDDIDAEGKVVLVRADLNCPVDKHGRIADEERIHVHGKTTIRELASKGARVVVLAHQGRPGDSDFIPLGEHAKILEKHCGNKVRFVDELFGSRAISEIRELKDGGILLLENVRFYSEELLELPASELSRTHMARRLGETADYFVNDAFSAIHREQTSLVGFSGIPAVAGRVMESEVEALDKALKEGERPLTFVMGGSKVEDSLKAAKFLLSKGIATKVLAGGLFGNLLLVAAGHDIGEKSVKKIREKGYDKLLGSAKEALSEHKGRLLCPADVALIKSGKRVSVKMGESVFDAIGDIGEQTIESYCSEIRKSRTVVFNSPVGIYEVEQFRVGTEKLLAAAADVKGYRLLGGGQTGDAVNRLGIADRFDHVSVGGKAILYYLSGEQMPVIEFLESSKRRWEGKV